MLLCLLLLAGCTAGPAAPTPVRIDSRPMCPLTPCQLPARQPLQVNADWPMAVDALETELMSCAAQVRACIVLQGATPAVPADNE
jgi:hypothetical protein